MATPLINAQATTGAGDAIRNEPAMKTFQAWGNTSSGTGAATIQIQGSLNDGASWDTIGTITLALGTAVTSDSFSSDDRFGQVRANVTAISGTGANVSAAF